MNKAESNSAKTEKPKATLQKVQPLKAKLVVADPGCRPVGN